MDKFQAQKDGGGSKEFSSFLSVYSICLSITHPASHVAKRVSDFFILRDDSSRTIWDEGGMFNVYSHSIDGSMW